MFANKLKEIRVDAGVSQERLAEELDISRQAVAKWEAGITMPDIDNLIGIGNFFQVSLDHLVRDIPCKTVARDSVCDVLEVIDFIVEAKKNTYASAENHAAARVASSRTGSKDLAYESGDFKYLDTYVGSSHFSGSEVVYHQEQPIWSMNYVGCSFSGQVGDFLTEMLSLVSVELPYRGPAFYRNGKFSYVNLTSGDFNWFQGEEKIYYENELIYELVYHGGMVK